MWMQMVIYYEEQTPEHLLRAPPPTPTLCWAAQTEDQGPGGSTWAQPHSWVPRPPRRQRNLLGGRAQGLW